MWSLRQSTFVKITLQINFTGDTIEVGISRTLPAAGVVTVEWNILGVKGHVASLNFAYESGVVRFSEVRIVYL